MTPDTSAYMIAGFVVILGGISFYILSIYVRNIRVRRQANMITTIRENQTNGTSKITEENHEE